MKKAEFIELINKEECPSLSDAFEVVCGIKDDYPIRVAESVNVKPHYYYVTATDVYRCDDGLVGVTGLASASDSYSEEGNEPILATACEYTAVADVAYMPKSDVNPNDICYASSFIGTTNYQGFAFQTLSGCPFEAWYMALGLTGEAGEVADKVKKVYRDKSGKFEQATREEIAHELGDCLWYLTNMATLMGYSIEDIARMNMEKITSRLKRGVLHGEGDYR